MDVSRIEAYNPNKINWRNLTAKEILKYQKQGVEVPDVYLQWAKEFLNNLAKYDNDDVTYEKAKSIERHNNKELKANKKAMAADNTNTQEETPATEAETTTEPTTNITGNLEDTELNAAQLKHKNMQDNGVSLRDQAILFTQESITSGQQAIASTVIMGEIQEKSDNEISELEGAMKELIAQAEAKQNELKQNVDRINQSKNTNSTFSKIEQLQKELKQLGTTGQNEIFDSNNTLVGYRTEIAGGHDIMINGADYGSETIDIGNELLATTGRTWWFNLDRIIGERAVNTGNDTVNISELGQDAVRSADVTNESNIGRIPELRNAVTSKTGVDAIEIKEQGNSNGIDPINGKEKEPDKNIKTAENDGRDTTDKLHLSIDELVKRKVRRGQYTQES